MTRPTTLTASHDTLTLTLQASEVLATETGSRTLTGTLIPYGAVGHTSAGAVYVPEPGRIQVPANAGHVKLVDEHRKPPVAIGYMLSTADAATGLAGSFHVGATPAGDTALLEASEKVRDAFSVELADVVLTDTGELVSARLTAVALVTTPAWAGSRLAAAHHDSRTTTRKDNRMTPEQRARLEALRALPTLTASEAGEFHTLASLEASAAPQDPANPPAQIDPPAAPSWLNASQVPPGMMPALVPQGAGTLQAAEPTRDVGDLAAALARVFSGVSRPELEAALSNITSTANIWTANTEYAGQLWSGLQYRRRWVELMSPGKLKSYKGTGWRWLVKPAVADYAGDKTAVPSNAPTTEAVNWTAARLAGAHDLDRKFVDFGDAEFIAAYYAAMTESYAKQSDAKALAFIIAQATAAQAPALPGGLLNAVMFAADAMDDNTSGAPVDYVLVNRTDRRALLSVTNNNLPAFLEAFGVDPSKFRGSASVPAGTVIVGTKEAAEFKELTETPIRVEAIDMANGGVDGGVFGYYATLLNHAGGIVKQTFTA